MLLQSCTIFSLRHYITYDPLSDRVLPFSTLTSVCRVLTRHAKALVVPPPNTHVFIKGCREERGWGSCGEKGVQLGR